MQTETASATTAEPLILTGAGYGIEILPAAEEAKAEILRTAAMVVEVNDPVGDAAAEGELKKLAAMRIRLEKARVEAKQPALDFGTTVDTIAKNFIAMVLAEEQRLKKAREGYGHKVLLERQRVLREMAEQRAAEEKAEALRRSEEQRIAAEKEAARREAERKAWEAETPEEEAEAQAAVEAVTAPEPEPEPVSPPIVREVVILPAAPRGIKMATEFEIVNLDLVYKEYPQLVTMEIRRMETLKLIESLTVGDELPIIPGLRIFKKAKA